jgi:hypothetical protein
VNSSAVASRFLFTVTLGRANLATQLTRARYPRRLPRVLSPEDIGRLIEAAPGPGLKYKAALSVAYGAGLRAAEVAALKVSDIDSKRISIRHDHAQRSPENPAYANWRIGQSRVTAPRIYQTIKNQPRRTVSSNKDAPNQRFGLKPTRQNCCPLAAAGCGLSVHRHQIPIAAPQPCPISRGFLLWRLSDDGPGACRSVHEGAVIRNPSQYRSLPKLFDHIVGDRDKVGGALRQTDLAAVRLMTSSNVVGCRTGRAKLFSPLRTRPPISELEVTTDLG